MTLRDLVLQAFSTRRNIEPVKRMWAGIGPRYVVHRFDIKGGIRAIDVLAESVTQRNSLLKRLKER